MASLFVVRGRDQGKHFQLNRDVMQIGRDGGNAIQLLDSEASRQHAEFRRKTSLGEFSIRDLGSSNGTIVNGSQVNDHDLRSGDRIEIGGTLMIFTGTSQPSAIEAAHGVDIVQQVTDSEASRIVSSIPPIVKSRLTPGSSSTGGKAPPDAHRVTGNAKDFAPADEDLSRMIANVFSKDGDRSSVLNRTGGIDADRSLEVMYLTAIAVGRTDDLDQVLQRVLRLVFDWLEADRGCIMLREPETNCLQPAARCDRDEVAPKSKLATISISRTILDYVIENKEGVRTSDAIGDKRFDSAQSIVQAGVREALCVPLQGRYDIVGALYIDTYSSPGELMRSGNAQRFNDDHLRLITAIGHQAALAIEDTFYYSALVQGERLAAMGQTIATLSHHIKNILQGIRGGSYLIDAGLKRDDTDAVKRGWKIVDRNQERISNLVLDMLTFSKERDPIKVEADLNETVADVVELMQTHASDHGVTLGHDLTNSIPQALFDPDALHRAILNLLTNAIDAAAAGNEGSDDDEDPPEDFDGGSVDDESEAEPESRTAAKVFVRTGFDSETGWYVDVIDNGPGIPTEDRDRIFSLFESKKGARGTGLGLPVSAKIMREHGGRIEVTDAPISPGTTFRLVLPPPGDSVQP